MPLGGFFGSDLVGGGGLDVERPDCGFGLDQVLQHLVDLGVLLLVVALRVLFAVPEAQSQNPIRFRVRHQNGLVHEAGLFFQDGDDFVLDHAAEFS